MKRTPANNNTNQPRRWTPLASVIAFFRTKPVPSEELAATLRGSDADIARSDKAIKEMNELLAEIDSELKNRRPSTGPS